MFDIKPNITRSKIRRFISEVGYNNIDDWFTLRKADSSEWCQKNIIEPFESRIKKELKEIQCGSVLQLDSSILGDAIQISGE